MKRSCNFFIVMIVCNYQFTQDAARLYLKENVFKILNFWWSGERIIGLNYSLHFQKGIE